MITYKITTIDQKNYKERIINNIERLEITSLVFIFHTTKGKRIRLRKDTWNSPIVINES